MPHGPDRSLISKDHILIKSIPKSNLYAEVNSRSFTFPSEVEVPPPRQSYNMYFQERETDPRW